MKKLLTLLALLTIHSTAFAKLTAKDINEGDCLNIYFKEAKKNEIIAIGLKLESETGIIMFKGLLSERLEMINFHGHELEADNLIVTKLEPKVCQDAFDKAMKDAGI
jgi:hypothetical protein